MLFATQSTSVSGAQKYFETVLTQGDYYLGQEVSGHWRGKGSNLLGLGQGSHVTRQQFVALLKGEHPTTGKRLTQRVRKDRRPGVDLTFSAPKSVSLAWAMTGDERIVQALDDATHETMAADVEPLMHRRVRKGKHAHTQQKSPTGKLIYADFFHKTSRPVDGHPDPHLHIHAFVMNWTEEAGTHYAGEFEEIMRQRPSLQAKFESRLARKLTQLGYSVEQVRFLQSGRLKRGWELKGIARDTIEKFSRRTEQIEQYAAEHGVEDAAAKGRLGRLTREKKDNGESVDQLRVRWRERLTPAEREAFARLLTEEAQGEEGVQIEPALRSVKYAIDHCLYRQSTVERHHLVATALEHGLTLRVKDVEQTLDSLGLIEREVHVNGAERLLVTTRTVLEAERRLIAYAREGRGTRKAISSTEHEFQRGWLNEHQQAAVNHVLQSRDAVMAVMGGAGTGKTSLMEEAIEAIEYHGKQVFTFAPSTGAKEVLEDKGFNNTQTVEHLIRNTSLHPKLKDQILWIDEAGLLDVRSMNQVFQIAKDHNTRVVLSGDTRQHASPRRGEAMRMLENEAGLKMARVENIQRQKGEYRKAVQLISKGYDVVDSRTGKTGLLAGFDLLDKLGKIKQIGAEERHTQLAITYAGAIGKKRSTLVVAPTHAEAQAVTAEIRTKLKQQDRLSSDERTFTQYRSLNLTEAERGEAHTYGKQQNLIIQFHQNTKGGINRGDRYRVTNIAENRVELTSLNGEQRATLPLNQPDRFEVYSEDRLPIAAGDKIRFSLGGTTQDNKSRISNGRLDEVKGFDRRGNLILKNGWVVDKNYAHIDLGYVITSHASQGKDRDVAIGALGSESLPAINARQFYVTVSRGREDVVLFVDDKAKVREAIQRSGEQLSASEMVRSSVKSPVREPSRNRQQQHARQSFRDRVLHWWRNRSQERSRDHVIGRHRQSSAIRDFGTGAPAPSRST